MLILDKNSNGAEVYLSRDEMFMLNNALNEICNGVYIDDAEFQTRLGWDRATLRVLLETINVSLR